MTFQEIEQRWQTARTREQRRAVWEALWAQSHQWFQACRAAVTNNDLHTIESWLQTPNAVQQACLNFMPGDVDGAAVRANSQTARAYLYCAQAILCTPGTAHGALDDPEAVLQRLHSQGLDLAGPLNWWHDLIYKLCTPDPERARPGRAAYSLPVCLVDAQGHGEVATLTLELVSNGRGELYPDIALAFVPRDTAFCTAEQAVCSDLHAAGVWPPESDVRWRISRQDAKALLELKGGSASGALAFGLAKLFTQSGAPPLFESLRTLSFDRLLITATYTATGALEPVTDVPAKLEALRASSSIRRVILAANQGEREAFLETAAQGLKIFWATTLQNAVEQLARYVQNLSDPFRPFRPFEKQDARYFFGRKMDTERLYKDVEQHRFVLLWGPSGSGKSSLVFAGLLPQLEKTQSWVIVDCRPGGPNFAEVEQALIQRFPPPCNADAQSQKHWEFAHPADHNDVTRYLQHASDQPLLFIIDQFEALFETSAQARESSRFLQALNQLVRSDLPCKVLVIFRADALDPVLSVGDQETEIFRHLVNDYKTFALSQMPSHALIEAIYGQVQAADLGIQAGLAESIVKQLEDGKSRQEASSLPFLQVILSELFQESKKGYTAMLTFEDFARLGDMTEVVARYTNKALVTLAEQQRCSQEELERHLKEIFLKLVRIDAASSQTYPTIVTRGALGARYWPLVREAQSVGLVKIRQKEPEKETDEDTAEVPHAALLRHWQLLSGWIKDEKDFLQWWLSFYQALENWRQHGTKEEDLLPTRDLQKAQAMHSAHKDRLPPTAEDFLKKSVQYRRFFWRTVGYTVVLGIVWRELFYRLFGSFLQPLPPWGGTLSPEVWNGALGAFLGALLVIVALEGPAKIPLRHRLPKELLLLSTGLLWGLAVLVFVSFAYNAESEEKIGWMQSRVRYAFIITGLGWSTGLALGEALWKRLATYIPGASVPVLWRFLSHIGMVGLMSTVPPFVLLHVLTNIPSAEILTRAWGESLGQGAIAASVLCFYYGFRWGLWDQLLAQLWPSRNPRHNAPASVR